jgi:hypothetical protein
MLTIESVFRGSNQFHWYVVRRDGNRRTYLARFDSAKDAATYRAYLAL